jgi:glycosyltransferase involved in cell wall biosynthesis
MRNVSVDIIEPLISDNFKKQDLPPKTIINIHTREHRDTTNVIKAFYSRFPQYRWFTFRDLRGLSEEEFAERMKDSFVSVWVDNISAYGTFPLESIKMGIPVIGVVPNMVPEWMNENNGIWINNQNILVDVIADYVQNWLEDNVSPELYTEMEKTAESLVKEEEFKNNVDNIFNEMVSKRISSFSEQLNKLETIE